MASVHDAKVNKLQVVWIGNLENENVEVQNTLEYTTARAFAGNQLISYNGVLSLIADMGGGGGGEAYLEVPFDAETGLVIDWQADIPPGKADTYVALLGNNIPTGVVVDSIPDPASPNAYKRIPFDFSYTTDGDGTLLTVTFDWAIAQSGKIIF